MAKANIAKYGVWTTGLLDCFEDCESCLCGCCCPCVLVGRIVEIIDQGANSCMTGGSIFCLLQYLTGCGCFYTFGYRSRLRQKFGLPNNACGDLCTDCCCLSCSLCQVYREIGNRVGNPTLGYENLRNAYEANPQQTSGRPPIYSNQPQQAPDYAPYPQQAPAYPTQAPPFNYNEPPQAPQHQYMAHQ